MPQRQSASRVSLPKPKKKLLSIVDPETQQEIKVSKATPTQPPPSKPTSSAPSFTKPTPVPINPPTSRPLSLVEDPADAPTSSSSTPKPAADKPIEKAHTPALPPSSEKSQTENFKPQPKINPKDSSAAVAESRTNHPAVSSSNMKRADVIGDTSVARDAISNGSQCPEEPEGASVVATADTISNNEVVDTTDVPDIVAKAEDNLDGMTSDVSSSTFADVRSDSTDLLPSHSSAKSDGHAAESAPVARQISNNTDTPRPTEPPAASSGVSSQPTETSPRPNGAGVAPPSAAVESVPGNVLDKKLSVSAPADSKDSDRLTADTTDKAMKDEEDPASDTSASKEEDAPIPEQNDLGPVFKPGDRRIYPPAFMHSMRTTVDAKKVAEFISALTQSDIMRGDAAGMKRNDSRGNPRAGGRAMRTGSGPLSSDPRGSRAAFANQPASGYVMPTFHSSSQVPAGGSGNYDLRSARLQTPPAPRAPPGNRSGDPRGSRSMRMDGPTRGHGQGPIDPFVQPRPPVEKLQRSEKGWKRNKDDDDDITKKVKQVRSLLNKLTIEKFEKIFAQIIAIDLSGSETLVGVVQEIFEKTLFEPKFSDMYAELCRRLDEVIQDKSGSGQKDESGKQLQFRRILLLNCKDEFTRFANAGKADEKDVKATETSEEKPDAEAAPKKTPAEERAEKGALEVKATKAKQRMIANVRFIGELYLKDLLKETIIHRQCIQKLLHQGAGTRDEDVLEAVCKLISKTGEKLSNNLDATKHMQGYFRVLMQIGHDPKLPPRIRFMIQDLVEQRENKWKVRREEAGAKTIAEIHEEAAQEEKAKTEAANALRERKSRGGGGGGGGQRGGRSFQARGLPITMASVSKAPSMSKPSLLDRQLNRSSSSSVNGPMPMQGMRLGPPGSKSGSASGGGGGMALRPNGSRSGSSGSRFSALGSADSGGLVSAGSGDARRGKVSKSPPLSRRPMSISSSRSEESSGENVAPMGMEIVKRKTKGLLQEYASIKILNEVLECLKDEFTPVNYAAFVNEAVKLSIDSKPQEAAIYGGLLGDIISNNVVEPKLFIDAFEKIGPTIPDHSMDSPLAPDLFSGIVAAVSAVDKFKSYEGSGNGGVGFMKAIVDGMEDRRTACKMVVLLCARRYEMLKGKMSDEERQRTVVTEIYDCIGVDLAADMVAWDSMMGPKMLGNILDRANMTFLISTFEYEMRLRELLLNDGGKDATSEKVVDAVKGHGSDVKLMKMVVRVSLDWVFDESRNAEKVADDYKRIIGGAVKTLGLTSKDAQIGALCATQKYFYQNESRVCNSLGNGEERNGSKVFRMLFDSDIVRKDCLIAWKEDMDVSAKIEGKEKMLFETSTFFTWLNQNQSDDA